MLEQLLVKTVYLAFEIYFWLIIARVLFSWIPLPQNKLLRTLYEIAYELTEPFLSLIRRFVPVFSTSGVGIDFSPFIAIILLQLIERALITVISLLF